MPEIAHGYGAPAIDPSQLGAGQGLTSLSSAFMDLGQRQMRQLALVEAARKAAGEGQLGSIFGATGAVNPGLDRVAAANGMTPDQIAKAHLIALAQRPGGLNDPGVASLLNATGAYAGSHAAQAQAEGATRSLQTARLGGENANAAAAAARAPVVYIDPATGNRVQATASAQPAGSTVAGSSDELKAAELQKTVYGPNAGAPGNGISPAVAVATSISEPQKFGPVGSTIYGTPSFGVSPVVIPSATPPGAPAPLSSAFGAPAGGATPPAGAGAPAAAPTAGPGPSGMVGNPLDDPSLAGLTGQEFMTKLATLGPAGAHIAEMAQPIIEYRNPGIVQGAAQARPIDQMIMPAVQRGSDGGNSYDASIYPARAQFRIQRDDASNLNSMATNAQSIQMLMEHLHSLAEQGDALAGQSNAHIPHDLNSVVNAGKNMLASPEQAKAENAYEEHLNQVAAESAKYFGGAAATDSEKAHSKALLSPNLSPPQRAAAIAALAQDLKAKADVIQGRNAAAMGPKDAFKVMPPATMKMYEAIQKRVAPAPGGPATPESIRAAVAPPEAAVRLLKSNPALAAHFDEKYGAGASARALGP